eukprot:tig00000704_g3312.t1
MGSLQYSSIVVNGGKKRHCHELAITRVLQFKGAEADAKKQDVPIAELYDIPPLMSSKLGTEALIGLARNVPQDLAAARLRGHQQYETTSQLKPTVDEETGDENRSLYVSRARTQYGGFYSSAR